MRDGGIEPPYTAWKAVILPLNYTRFNIFVRAAGNWTRALPTPWANTTVILQPVRSNRNHVSTFVLQVSTNLFSRAAGNRTQALRSQSANTTVILQPVVSACLPLRLFILARKEAYSNTRFFFLNKILSLHKRPWFSGRMRPCQGRDESSILSTRTLLILMAYLVT